MVVSCPNYEQEKFNLDEVMVQTSLTCGSIIPDHLKYKIYRIYIRSALLCGSEWSLFIDQNEQTEHVEEIWIRKLALREYKKRNF